jgi:hypothetical protein
VPPLVPVAAKRAETADSFAASLIERDDGGQNGLHSLPDSERRLSGRQTRLDAAPGHPLSTRGRPPALATSEPGAYHYWAAGEYRRRFGGREPLRRFDH